ncbi:cytochrome c oxidase assembly protein [bacterium AH-315-J23]|nr:cytochrome c oxidase assembly protein [bacterium AH-315-J23]PHQ59159.1 MAG: cytochrome c oxidase assembly protein [Robiginitomaculum sp.]PHQ67878.1 MAG: cytochrome c oxidase assembly protein [Robiginitomaculum sp.]
MEGVRKHNSNRKVVLSLSVTALAMLGLGFASKPLYDTFCRVTGYGGTTRVAEQMSEVVVEREIKVRFDANVASNLGWTFKPDEVAMTVKLGQNALAYYTATNDTKYPIVGTASYNVSPIKAAPYFSKLECFCFTEQRLEPGETVSMPVLFFVDPEMENDKRLDEIKTITLSYTFHRVENPTNDAVRAEQRQAQLDKLEAIDLDIPQPINTTNTQGRG